MSKFKKVRLLLNRLLCEYLYKKHRLYFQYNPLKYKGNGWGEYCLRCDYELERTII